ncbi:peptidoglycan bridge formation protein FemAB [Desulfonema ishimotonii]|uniref:Peptidoglycan bridge formation protein FemAB n=1 Tax=Desulfonema ishimotonii TaxID=45657 RepID=A0A401FQI1_9BACT|nr:FemAB family XrtA/PEP-CTERM system-associated protein [Desulfonema ishimotonii]GBC59244.1 peptidoglycan bridge formation protein FemAB [Desulfonema ishimotonii]
MNIRLYTDADSAEWDTYVTRHPRGSFFHLSRWKKAIETSFGHQAFYLIATATASPPGGSEILGVFPLFSVKSFLFGKSMVSVPFAACGGILAESEAVEHALYQYAVRLTKENKLDYLELRNEDRPFSDLPGKDLYYVFKKEISSDNDKNLKAIPRKTRAMVRKGIKNNLQARFGKEELLAPFYDLFAFNYRRLGTPVFSKSYLKNLLEIFDKDSNVLIIYKDNTPLSGVITFYYKDQVIPYYSGAFPEANRYAANDYLYWALMSDAAEKGYRIFDFGRSKRGTGSYHFKKHWGFEPRMLHYQYYLNTLSEMPNISPANPKYQRLIRIWQQIPLCITNAIGPSIVKYIP